jgi:hypothetical protein
MFLTYTQKINMETIREIFDSKRKPKEIVSGSAERILQNPKLFDELMTILKTGSDVEKGTCADIMKHVTAEKPEIAEPFIEELISFINYKAPRVKWGVPESIGNIAKKSSQKVEKVIPFLLKNTPENKDNSTVIRWCAAYALSEIAKASGDKNLLTKIKDISEKENNNGVKNVYLKAIKLIEKNMK